VGLWVVGEFDGEFVGLWVVGEFDGVFVGVVVVGSVDGTPASGEVVGCAVISAISIVSLVVGALMLGIVGELVVL